MLTLTREETNEARKRRGEVEKGKEREVEKVEERRSRLTIK
jgi:hypothetical protein